MYPKLDMVTVPYIKRIHSFIHSFILQTKITANYQFPLSRKQLNSNSPQIFTTSKMATYETQAHIPNTTQTPTHPHL
jgi:hypothetical protein